MKRRVLIVDDDAEITHGLGQQLDATNGYETMGVTEALHVIPTVRVWRPDVILLDLLLPKMNGSEIARRLAADPALQKVPLIFMTVAVTEDAAARAGIIGPHRFLTKPIHLHELLLNIEAACSETAYDRPAESQAA